MQTLGRKKCYLWSSSWPVKGSNFFSCLFQSATTTFLASCPQSCKRRHNCDSDKPIFRVKTTKKGYWPTECQIINLHLQRSSIFCILKEKSGFNSCSESKRRERKLDPFRPLGLLHTFRAIAHHKRSYEDLWLTIKVSYFDCRIKCKRL